MSDSNLKTIIRANELTQDIYQETTRKKGLHTLLFH